MKCPEIDNVLFLICSAAWGFHPGGWGKPPLDDNGRPLYGDIYGITQGMTQGGDVSCICFKLNVISSD